MGKELPENSNCPECGALHRDGLTCRSVFDEFLVLELTDPNYGAVHLLTVACYMIQHGQYTDEALTWIERMLRDYLEEGIPIEQVRQQAAKETDQGRRNWKVIRRPGDPPQVKIPWSMASLTTFRKLAIQYGLMEPSTGREIPPDPPEEDLAPAPEQRRRARLMQVYALLAVLAFGILAFLAYTLGHFDLDVSVSLFVQSFQPAWFDILMRAVSAFGYIPQAWIIVAGSAALFYVLRMQWEALVTALAGIVSALLGSLAKLVIARPRPSEDLVEVLRDLPGFGFPSGHVVFYSGFYGFLWFLVYTLLPRGPLRTTLLVLLGGLVALVGLSRVYLGVHWASDAIGGYLLGSLALLVSIAIYRRGKA